MIDTQRDWALLVGIDGYPTLNGADGPGDLSGAIGDMEDFARFLTGNFLVNPEQIIRVQSPHPDTPPNVPVSEYRLNVARQSIRDKYDELRRSGPNWRQRRMYMFMAGHGFIPNDDTNRAIILAESTNDFISHFIAQEAIAAFTGSKMFEEVVLFMDCCAIRSFNVRPHISDWNLGAPPEPGLPETKVFKAFAAAGNQPTRECALRGSGEYRGLFTQFLLRALSGDHEGKVTTASLKRSFEQAGDTFKGILSDVFFLQGDEVFVPHCPADPGFEIFDFKTSQPINIPIQLRADVHLADGYTLEVWEGGVANGVLVDTGTVANGQLSLVLPNGLVTLRINNTTSVFVEVANQEIVRSQ